jgi:hypothetical protein
VLFPGIFFSEVVNDMGDLRDWLKKGHALPAE